MNALTLAQLCAREYNDAGYARIALNQATSTVTNGPDWLTWLNDAQRAVVLVRPDANSTTAAVAMAAGTRQTLPSGGIKLLDVVRNMGVDGATVGKALRGPVSREALDEANPDWHTATVVTAGGLREWMYDDKKDPLTYWVNPPVTGASAVYAQIIYARLPTDAVLHAAASVTADATADTITLASHGLVAGSTVVFAATGMPAGLTAGTTYYVINPTTNTFQVAATAGGAAINLTSAGSGVTVTGENGISLSDIYAAPLQSWMMMKAYLMAAQAAPNFARARFYATAFFQQLGIKFRADMWLAAGGDGAMPPAAAAA